tara:strand:- start:353 stop:571 length:219 start_codon:yes stop_codon:yes gene_type:complete
MSIIISSNYKKHCKIEGLITKYGDSNSHMAIRFMELGLPAIIRVGDKIYDKLSISKKIFIDCIGKNIQLFIK